MMSYHTRPPWRCQLAHPLAIFHCLFKASTAIGAAGFVLDII